MKNTIKAGIIFFALLLAVSILACVLFWPFIARLRFPEYRARVGEWIDKLGPRGALVLLGIQVTQIIVAVIPGGPLEILAGAAYGALGGYGICVLGCLISTAVIFLMVRKFGAPLVIRFFGSRLKGRYAFLRPGGLLSDTKKFSLALFLLFLIPGVPKDILTYVASLRDIKLSRFLLISCTARSPAILMSTMLGSSMLQGNWVAIAALFAAIAGAGVVGVLYGDKIVDKLQQKH
jgi:uncharacterized membrane protein YdjX (TVP38/TMEM64 family)